MILVIDVGNTNITLGVYNNKELLGHWRMATNVTKTSDEIGMFILSVFYSAEIKVSQIKAVVICSVVPPIMHSLINTIKKYIKLEPMLVEPGVKTGINIKYENPREVGADRIVNAVAACELYGGNIIIVDFGTATTFCAIKENRDYLGGVIAPGIKISADALFQKASKLPRIELVKPQNVIGKTTVTSMQSGMVYGYVGQIDFIVKKMKLEMNLPDIKVIATGGLASLVASESETVDEINRMLTMEGLRIIYDMNTR